MVMQTNPSPALVAADLAQAKTCPPKSQGALAQVQPTGLYLGGNGAIDGAVDATFDQAAGAYAVMPVIRNYEGPIVRSDLLANMLVDNAQRAAHIDNLVNLAVGNNYKGIDIDYRGLDKNLRGEFNQFIKELAEKLDAQGKDSQRTRRAGRAGGGRPLGDRPLRLADAGPAGRHGEDPRAAGSQRVRPGRPVGCAHALRRRSDQPQQASGHPRRPKHGAGGQLPVGRRATPTRSSRCSAAWLPIRRSSSRASR